jgi:NAD(P)-dependent dehydrogenase (short-subunit alcohol dehydrogenase family)
MTSRLADKVAIVTGGSSGFGFGIVEKFIEEGCKCLILDITPGRASDSLTSRGVLFLQGDVSSRGTWEKALEIVLKEFGRLDIVVNNAGILIVKVFSCWV